MTMFLTMTRVRALLLFKNAPHCNRMEKGAWLESCNAGAASVVEFGRVLMIWDVGEDSEQFTIGLAVAKESRRGRQTSLLASSMIQV
jgi:hypothetical protein